jgi:spore coat polysaccharide biosynthesis protein SpsF
VNGVLAVIQARMGSRRLPGKMLASIDGRSLLELVVARTLAVRGIGHVVVATSDRFGDDVLAEEVRRAGVDVFRGSEDDVLDRYHACATVYGAGAVLRVCGDCPVLDVEETARLLDRYAAGADCVHNKHDRGVVWGAGAELVDADALGRAWRAARVPREREHVTPYIREHTGRFTVVEVDAAAAKQAPDLDLSIDSEEDLAGIRAVAARLDRPLAEAPIEEVIIAARSLGMLRRLEAAPA